MKILIDPGHRNNDLDFGATGNGQKESALALQISLKLKKELENHGIICYLTRASEQETISVSGRPHKAWALNVDLLVSVHINSAGATATGIEVLYKNEEELAKQVCNAMCKATGAANRGAKLRNDLGVLNGFKSSILIECGFISNPTDCKKLCDVAYQDKLVKAIVGAIIAKYRITVQIKENEEMITKTKINLNGKVKEVEAINKEGHVYVKLRDLQDSKIQVDYQGMPIVKTI